MIYTRNTTKCPFNIEIGSIILFESSIIAKQKEKLYVLLNVSKY